MQNQQKLTQLTEIFPLRIDQELLFKIMYSNVSHKSRFSSFDVDSFLIIKSFAVNQKEYKARHDWEMCKKFKFDHTNKWYMHNPAPVQENDTHKLLWDFNIQTVQLTTE